MLEVGRVCVKLAGREAGAKCVVVKLIDDNFVLIDGDVKRRKCNKNHLLPLVQVISIPSGAKTEVVKGELIKLGLMSKSVKSKVKPKKVKSPRPRRSRKKKVKVEKPVKKSVAKKPVKK